MVELKDIQALIKHYLNDFNITKIKDNKLQFADGYYSDPDLSKYIFYFQIFENKETMLESWKSIQNEDIALYMQRQLFPYKDIRWDIYFVLVSCDTKPVEEEELLLIEKDKFCCKKVVVDGRTIEELENGLKAKLPFTKNYYPMDSVVLINEENFLDELRKSASLNENIFTNELLINIDKNKDKIGELLKNIEVQL